MQKLQNLRKLHPKEPPLWKPKSAKIEQKGRLERNIKRNIQKVSENNAKTEAQHFPNQAFRLKRQHFLSFAASAKKCAKGL